MIVKISPAFVQDPATEGLQAFADKRRCSTWLVWFLPKRWKS